MIASRAGFRPKPSGGINVRVIVNRVNRPPKLEKPTMVCGLPDAGNVAKLVIDSLINSVQPTLLAELYCFSLPPKVMVSDKGVVDPLKHYVYALKREDSAGDLIIYGGDIQPESPQAAYTLADRALSEGHRLGAKNVITVGAYITGKFTEKPVVYALATDSEQTKELEQAGFRIIKEGEITYMNGLLIGLAKLHGMSAVFFSGETPGYAQVADGRAARAVLEVLAQRLNLRVDTSKLDSLVKESDEIVRSISEMQEHAEQVEKKGAGTYIR